MKCQAEYSDLKLDWAIRLSNNKRGSKFCLSFTIISRSYLIPTVKIVKRLIWSESIFDPAQISLFTISTLNFFFTQPHRIFKEEFCQIFLFHAGYIVPSNQSSALHQSLCLTRKRRRVVRKNVKTLLQRERDLQLNLNLLMTSFRIFFTYLNAYNAYWILEFYNVIYYVYEARYFYSYLNLQSRTNRTREQNLKKPLTKQMSCCN